MARGGKRTGAGRKPGTRNKRRQEIMDKAAEAGLLPLEYMLQVLRDVKNSSDERFRAAKAAAPYLHPQLSTIKHEGDPDNPLEVAHTIRLAGPDD